MSSGESSGKPVPPTMRELAKSLGLSIATVSRALRNSPHVLPETRARVQEAMRRTGYRSHALVNALMAQVRQRHRLQPTGEVVAYLTSHSEENGWKVHPAHVAQIEGARERAMELGFRLEHMWLGYKGCHSRQVARVLAARGVRGSLLAPLPVDHHPLELDWQQHAVVTLGYSWRQTALHRAVHDNVGLAFSCHAHLRALGYRRIGLALQESDDSRVKHLWRTGFLGAQSVHGGEPVPLLLYPRYRDAGDFLRWYDEYRPDAVISIWQDFPLTWLREHGVRVPEDTGYATLDLGAGMEGKLAGMRQDNRDLGASAMDMLASQLFRNEIGIPKTALVTMIDGTWIDGPTVARQGRSGKQRGRGAPGRPDISGGNG
ncbi:transcriptional regulator [Opitutaceae bacterium TAV5]|nr:transcriptional regulator [Opitutaceae bacterium TAV5]